MGTGKAIRNDSVSTQTDYKRARSICRALICALTHVVELMYQGRDGESFYDKDRAMRHASLVLSAEVLPPLIELETALDRQIDRDELEQFGSVGPD